MFFKKKNKYLINNNVLNLNFLFFFKKNKLKMFLNERLNNGFLYIYLKKSNMLLFLFKIIRFELTFCNNFYVSDFSSFFSKNKSLVYYTILCIFNFLSFNINFFLKKKKLISLECIYYNLNWIEREFFEFFGKNSNLFFKKDCRNLLLNYTYKVKVYYKNNLKFINNKKVLKYDNFFKKINFFEKKNLNF